MNLTKLSFFSIVGCLIGLAALLVVTVISAGQIRDRQQELAQLVDLRARINDFSVASDNLVIFGADTDLWRAYRAEGEAIAELLKQPPRGETGGDKAARRVATMVEFVGAALGYNDSQSLEPDALQQGPLPTIPARERIIQQRVAGQGIALDRTVNSLLRERQQGITREATRIVIILAAGTLLFGALCVLAFGLIHRRVARPARNIAMTLEDIQSGKAHARAAVDGNDELSELAETLNRTLDQRDAALKELETTRDRLLRAQAIARIGSWELDLSTERLQWSDQASKIFGVRREDFSENLADFFERIHPNDREHLLQRRQQWLEHGGEFNYTHRIVRPDGEVRWVRQQARITPGSDGEPAFTTGTVQDITDQRRLEERQRQFQQLIEGSEDWYCIVDEDYRFVWANRAYADRSGLDPEAIPGMTLPEVIGESQFEDTVRPRLDRCLGGEIQRFETTRDLPGRGDRHLLARYYPIKMPGQSSYRVGAVITDITDMRRVEAQVARQSRLLDMAGRAARFGAWFVDLATQRIEWSDVVAEIHGMPHGYSPSVDESIRFYAPEHRDRITEVYRDCVEHGTPYDEEFQIIDTTGQRRWVRSVGELVRDAQGEIVGVQGAFQDISAQKDLALESERINKRLATMLESITDGFVAFDEQWRYTYVNAEAERLLGKSADGLIGGTVWSQFQELAGTKTETALRSAMTQRVSASAEEFFEPLDGWFEMRAYPWEGGVAAIFRDVTETHRMLEQLRAQEAALRASSEELNAALQTRQALINSLPAHIAMLDAEGVVIDVNDQWRHFGEENDYDGSDFGLGKNYAVLCETATGSAAEEAGDVARGLRDVLSGRKDSFALEYPCHSPHEERWFRVMFNRLATDDDEPFGAVAMHIDITERKQAERRIRRLAYEDAMTGALSRNGFVQRLNEQLEADGWPAGGCLAMIDVVNQHDINDAHGYDRGDQVLKAISERLQSLVDGRGLAGRTGGDEFVVYIAFAAGEDIETVMQQLEQTVDEPFVLDEGEVSIDIELCIGYTAFGKAQRTAQDLIREAELALFEQRRDTTAAGHRRAYTQELQEETQQRIQLTQELQRAVANEEFELHFQPKVDLADGRMISAEALIRWHHPDRGLLPPGLFIPLAEQSQLIGPIGDWALRAACRQLSEWRENGLDAVRVAVNVSQVQFVLGDFPARVRAALEAFDVDPQHLSLEITESVFERQSDQLLSDFRALHDIGVRLALDDFGTGYASLLYVQRYPFDEIKIDRGFVDRVLEDDYSRDIVLAVISVARSLGAEVVAEGIESAAIAAALRDMGCKVGQGYYFSVPLQAEDFRRLLENGSALPLASD